MDSCAIPEQVPPATFSVSSMHPSEFYRQMRAMGHSDKGAAEHMQTLDWLSARKSKRKQD